VGAEYYRTTLFLATARTIPHFEEPLRMNRRPEVREIAADSQAELAVD